jgi:hypothetical protein
MVVQLHNGVKSCIILRTVRHDSGKIDFFKKFMSEVRLARHYYQRKHQDDVKNKKRKMKKRRKRK